MRLQEAGLADAGKLHDIQIRAFQGLLEKYRDYNTNPAAEPLEKIVSRMRMENSYYYFIVVEGEAVGFIRIQNNGADCKVSPICILPEYQGWGYAQRAMLEAEKLYPQAVSWELGTIKEEQKLCYFYEKLGYRRTGKETSIQPGMTIAGYEKIINLKG